MDIATMFNKYAFLGHEYLTWLMYASEKKPWALNVLKDRTTELTIGKKVVLINEKPQAGKSAKVTVEGEESDLKEALVAIKDGGWVSDIHLRLKINDVDYEFTISAQEFKFSGFKTTVPANTKDDNEIDGAIMERMLLISDAMEFIDLTFERFLKARLNGEWKSEILPDLSAWVTGSESSAPGKPMNEKIFT